VRNRNLTETGSVFPKYFASVDFLVLVFSFQLVSKSLMINLVIMLLLLQSLERLLLICANNYFQISLKFLH